MRPVSIAGPCFRPCDPQRKLSRITVDALQEQMEVKPNTGFNRGRRVILI